MNKIFKSGYATGAAMAATTLMGAVPTATLAQAEFPEQFEEVVVTARRREESIQQVPVSVTAYTAAELSERGAFQVNDLLRSTPNVISVDPNVVAPNSLQIRGIGYNARNIGVEAGATIYVDGVYTGRPYSFNQAFLDVANVEILRGPQGTLFGKNSIAGVISINTVKPEFDRASGRVVGSYGTAGQRRASLTLNTPVADNAALRVSVSHRQDDGYHLNVPTNTKFNEDQTTGGRAAFRWALTDDLEIILRGNYFTSEDSINTLETLLGDDPWTLPPRAIVSPGPLTTAIDTLNHAETRFRGASATIGYVANEALTLTSITGYDTNSQRRTTDADGSVLNVFIADFKERQEQFTQELRASGTIGKLDYVGGLYYFHQDSFQANTGLGGLDFTIPGLLPPGVIREVNPTGTIDTKSYAAYLDVTYKLTERLELEAGARFNREKKTIDFEVTSELPILFYTIARDTDDISDDDFSPTLGLRYFFADDVMGYVRYAKGYKSGGWNADFAGVIPGRPAPSIESLRFEAEYATTYEVGVKSELADRLILNLAAFYTDFENLQVTQYSGINLELAGGGAGSVVSSAGKATIKGTEVEATWAPTDNLQLSAGVGYQEAVYDRFDNAGGLGVSAAGKDFVGVPNWTVGASGQYAFPLANSGQVVFRGDYSYVGERDGDVLNTPTRLNPSYGFANARIGYVAPNDIWQLFLWSRNVTDREYIQLLDRARFAAAQSSPVTTVSYGRPRTYGVEFQARF